ncbi:hypothetical protein [Muricoccus radiodurans]|uniref:hypothetical protein n=1 Tax=Muricoccus radiodurans TaxID=2231721 RepID=UPI003CE963FB
MGALLRGGLLAFALFAALGFVGRAEAAPRPILPEAAMTVMGQEGAVEPVQYYYRRYRRPYYARPYYRRYYYRPAPRYYRRYYRPRYYRY